MRYTFVAVQKGFLPENLSFASFICDKTVDSTLYIEFVVVSSKKPRATPFLGQKIDFDMQILQRMLCNAGFR